MFLYKMLDTITMLMASFISFFRVLQELMTPVECLMPVEIMGRNYEGRHIVHELESAIVMTKKLFLDTRVTKALIDLMSTVLQVGRE